MTHKICTPKGAFISCTRNFIPRIRQFVLLLCLALTWLTPMAFAAGESLPVRGIHLGAPSKKDIPLALEFIKTALPREGVNVLILEFNYGYDYQSRKEFADPTAPGKAELQELSKACKENGIELIPMINCLGHQSWAQRTAKLLQVHPEFDETPGKYPNNKDIYCRSYCPLHPQVHEVLFALMDELAEACEAKSFHVGMDEVFILGDADCPRCKGKSNAELFAGEVTRLQEHLKTKGCRMWMWGDRFIDGKATRIGKWEASENGTGPAVDQVPKDIVICDWHYEKAHETAAFFAKKGFDVVSCPWRKPAVALEQLAQIQKIRSGPDQDTAKRALGMVHTTWCGFSQFAKAYQGGPPYFSENGTPANNAPAQSADCFKKLFNAIKTAP